MSRTIAVADIGGTNARFALAGLDGPAVAWLGEPVTFKTHDFAGLAEAWRAFGRQAGEPLPGAIGISFAGPVDGPILKLTNSPWAVRAAQLPAQLGVEAVTIVNDFAAIGHAVARLGDDCFSTISGPDRSFAHTGVLSVVGPGTGLGVAQVLRRADGGYEVLPTEGGHIDFAPLDSLDDRLLAFLRHAIGRVSVERVACGSGLVNLYNALAAFEQRAPWSADDKALWTTALAGEDPLAVAALDRFFLILGGVAGDFALAHGANGVVIAGGLGYRLRERFAQSGFAARFVAKGRFEQRMQAIPVKLINHPQPGLYGAAAAFAREHC